MKRLAAVAAFLATAALLAWFLFAKKNEPPREAPAEAARPAADSTVKDLVRQVGGHVPPSTAERLSEVAAEAADPVSVSGRVLGSDGSPLQDAWVRLSGGEVRGVDADGRFLLPAPRGRASVEFLHHRHLPRTLEVDAPAEGVEVRLESGLGITGRVSFLDGRPVPGAGIQAEDAGAYAVTDDTGSYALSGLVPGDVSVWCVDGDLRRTSRAGSAGVDFVLDKHLVRVRVVDEEGDPVEDASFVYSGFAGEEKRMSGAGSMDPEGETLAAPAGTRITWSTSAEGREQAAGEVLLEGPPALHEIRAVLPRRVATGSLDLRVADDQGNALPHCYVSVLDASGSSLDGFGGRKVPLDPGGEALLEGIQAGAFRVRVQGTGGAWDTGAFGLPFEKDVEIETDRAVSLDVVLESGGWVRVTVKDAAGTVLAPDAVRLLDEAGRFVGSSFYGQDGDVWSWPPKKPGPVTYDSALPAGRYTVEVLRGPQVGEKEVVGTAAVQVPWREVVDVEICLEK